MKIKKSIKILSAAAIVVAAGLIYSCSTKEGPREGARDMLLTVDEESSASFSAHSEEETTSDQESEETKAPRICVYICGSVLQPGIYWLEAGGRVFEAVEAAGGLAEDAASWYVNLAREAADGEQIYIPSIEEVIKGELPQTEVLQTTAKKSQGTATGVEDGLIDLNTATEAELQQLSGIGESKARAIIEYRQEVGGFASIEEVMNVAGIKEGSFAKIKKYIKV